MKTLPEGTMIEASLAPGVHQIYVVEEAVTVRPASPFERFRYYWRTHRAKTGDMAAACDAIYAIEEAAKVKP